MKHLPPDKYNVAWFKLAECIVRGEKERALGVYRLLTYSIPDKAYALKLEGDILFAFKDAQATQRYQAAITAYQNQGRFREAVAIGEYLLSLIENDRQLIDQLIILHKQLGDQKKVIQRTLQLIWHLLLQEDFLAIEELIQNTVDSIPHDSRHLFKTIVLRYVSYKNGPKLLGECLLIKFLNSLDFGTHDSELHQFLCELELLDHDYYNYALAYVMKEI